jgi:hypothetical protein
MNIIKLNKIITMVIKIIKTKIIIKKITNLKKNKKKQ